MFNLFNSKKESTRENHEQLLNLLNLSTSVLPSSKSANEPTIQDANGKVIPLMSRQGKIEKENQMKAEKKRQKKLEVKHGKHFIGPSTPIGYIHPNVDHDWLTHLNYQADFFFASAGKSMRERWQAGLFLNGLRVKWSGNNEDLTSIDDDPPDVLFLDFKMEVKEAMDPAYERHKEIKSDRDAYISHGYIPGEGELLGMRLGEQYQYPIHKVFLAYCLGYVFDYKRRLVKRNVDYSQIDLVFYCNIGADGDQWDFAVAPETPRRIPFISRIGFRSISIVTNAGSTFVLHAAKHAPKPLKNAMLKPPTPHDFDSPEWEGIRSQSDWKNEISEETQIRWDDFSTQKKKEIAWRAKLLSDERNNLTKCSSLKKLMRLWKLKLQLLTSLF